MQADPAPGPGQFTVNVVNKDGSKGTIHGQQRVGKRGGSHPGAGGGARKRSEDHPGLRSRRRRAAEACRRWRRQRARFHRAGRSDFPWPPRHLHKYVTARRRIRDAIVNTIPNVSDCADVTDVQSGRHHRHTLSIADGKRYPDVASWRLRRTQQPERAGFAAYNTLASLPQGVFDDLAGLRWLRLNNNQLTELSPDLFTSLTGLEHLYLGSNNLITRFRPACSPTTPTWSPCLCTDNGLTEVPVRTL